MILHQHFKTPQTGGAIRSYYLSKALVDRGIQTVVITAHNKVAARTEIVEGIVVDYLPIPYDNRFGFYKRIHAFFQFMVQSARYAAEHRDADLCYAISVPLTTGLAALWIRKKLKIPFIFEVGDLWPEAPIQMGFIRNPLLKMGLYRLEKAIYKNAGSIVALSPAIQAAVRLKAPGKKVHLLTNMADTGFFKPEEKRRELVEKFSVKEKFVVAYIGAVGVANGLDYFLGCARVCEQAGLPVHFLLCGEGAMLDTLKQSARDLFLQHFTFLPFQNREGVAEVLNVTDATFICYQPVKILETGSPNKYFDGLAAGKLTLINFGGWIREEVEQERCGIYMDPRYPEDFVEKIKPFLEDPALLKKYQQAGRLLAKRKYSRKMLGDEFCGIIGGSTKLRQQ